MLKITILDTPSHRRLILEGNLLVRAEAVEVLAVDPERYRDHGQEPGTDIAWPLARHGAEVDVQRVASGREDIGRALLSQAAKLNMRKRTPGNNGPDSFRGDTERRTRGWIGVDLDGTLAKSVAAQTEEIGPPIDPMVKLVKKWLSRGEDVRIFTARVNPNQGAFDAIRARSHIEAWCEHHLGQILPITYEKDWDMELLFDDRARQVERDTGRVVGCPVRTDLKAHRNAITRSRRRIEESPSAFNTGCKRWRGSRRK